MKLDTALQGYRLDLQASNKSDNTLTWYMKKLRPFIEWLADEHGVTDTLGLQPFHIKEFLVTLRRRTRRGKPLSDQTIHGSAQSIQTFCHWLAREGYSEQDAWRGMTMPKVENRQVQAFSATDIGQMLDEVASKEQHGLRNYAIILLLYDTAVRLAELVGLKLSDIDWQTSQLTVHGKGKKVRSVPMGRQTHRALWRYVNDARPEPLLPNTDEVFLNRDGEPLTGSGVYRIVKLAGKQAGITGKRLSPHTIRHAAAEDFLRNGGDAFSLQKLLGHTTLDVTRIYVDRTNADVQNAHRRASPGDNLRRRRKEHV